MGKIVEEKRKKKKGRPSLLDLQKRSLKQQQNPNPNFTPNSHFRNPNQNRRFSLRNSNSDAVSADPDRIESEGHEDEEGDSKREKKLKFVLRLSTNQLSSSFNSADSNPDEGNEETQLKKRKINAVRDRSALGDGEKEEKQSSGSRTAADDVLAGTQIESVPTTPLPDKKLMVFILDRLQKKDTYGVFSEPVDPKELPDYHEIIEHPMDFGTVRKNLLGGVYTNLEQFEKDVFLICSNAMRYNSADTIYFRQARSIQELAKRDFDNLRQDSDDNDPRPKVVRRGRPPTKNLKKNIGGQSVERAGSEVSSSTLATGADATSWSNSYDLRKGLSGSADALGRTSNKSRHGGAYNGLAEHRSDGNDEFPASVLKGMWKYGKKDFILDENRRNTYNQSHVSTCGHEESVLNTFDGEKKQLMAVGFHMEYSFARSLARFAATLGPIAWKIATKKIERALPAGMKFGPGWVGEQEKTEKVTSQQSQPTPYQAQCFLPQQASSLPRMSSTMITSSLADKEGGNKSTVKHEPSGDPATDIHSNKAVSLSSDVHLNQAAPPSHMVSSSSDVHSNRAAAPTTMVHPNRAAPTTTSLSSSSVVHPNRAIRPTTMVSSSSDFHLNKAILPPTMVSSSCMATNISPELAKERGGVAQVLNYQGGFSSSDSSGAAVRPYPPFQIQQAPLLKNGFSGGFGYNPASQSQMGKSVRASAPLGGLSSEASTTTRMLSAVSSRNNNVLLSKPANHPESDKKKLHGGANTTNSGNSATDSRHESQPDSEKLLSRQPSLQGLSQHQQSDSVPPDLNVRSLSPSSPQHPDLVLQL